MNLVSILGLLALLGIAWALSYHRMEVRWRPIIWGLALQFLFAVIILRQDHWSYVGMGILGLLISAYLLQGEPRIQAGGWPSLVGALAGAAVLGFAATLYLASALPWLVLVTLTIMLLNLRFRWSASLGRRGGVLLVLFAVAFLVSRELYGQRIFSSFSGMVADFLNLSDYGAQFLFGNLARPEFFGPNSYWPGFGLQFAFKVLPTILFFGGFMAVMYYLGVMQKVIEGLSRFMRWTIGTSGAETLSCSANIFVGQTEAPLLIKPFLDGMTTSELLTIMVGGFATIAGGVLAAYIALGVPAAHLIAASVMSAPAALVIGKLIYPEKEHSQTAGDVKLPDIDTGGNVIEAAANGITDGLRLAVNVGAMLIGFIALIAVLDVLLNWLDSMVDGRALVWLDATTSGRLSSLLGKELGSRVSYLAQGMSPAVAEYVGVFPGSLQTLFGTVLRPLAWLMGVPWNDAGLVGNLLGIKLSLNEFVAYGTLGAYIQDELISERAKIISTYALCGFANFSSIGIQIGGISAVAPSRRSDLARVGLKAMLGGALASWLTATIAGILL